MTIKPIENMAWYKQEAGLALNRRVSERLREAATLLSFQHDNPYRLAAYRRAADAIDALDRDLGDIISKDGIKALEEIPGVGRSIAAALAEMVRTGQWTYLARLRGSMEPEDVFRAVPGIGPQLAKRLHESFQVDTLEQLEAALAEPAIKKVQGLGVRRLAILRASLNQILGRIRSVRTTPADEPPVGVFLDVDKEYRMKVETDELRKIAPKRFNPNAEAWLPILHTKRGEWHFTALFSNTARAHELGRVHDWVVIYCHSETGGEAQRTVVTETKGALTGHRVVRGRETDSLRFYETATGSRS
jgi:hypothetical protein